MRMIECVVVGAGAAMEGQEQQTPRIERGHQRGRDTAQNAYSPKPVCAAKADSRMISLDQKPAKNGHPPVPDCRSTSEPRHLHLGEQATHLAHVLLVIHPVDHTARAKEQQRLEEGVGHQMENGGRIGADAEAKNM